MGALAPVTPPWTTKDDFLLRNALEAGASLESLAKGAVQFSRRFTITELQDRWNSILFDVNTSIDASMRMIEFERSAFKRTSKSKRAGNSKSKSKENKCGHGKRKAKSTCRCYYAMRKRMCCEPLNPGNLSFQGDSYEVSGSEAPGANNMLQDPVANHFGLQDTSFDDFDVLPQVMTNNAPLCGVDEFPKEQPNRLEYLIEQNHGQKEIPLGNSMAMAGNCTRLGQVDLSKELPEGRSIFQPIEANLMANSKGIMSSNFGQNTILNSPVADCETSFNHMQYTSPPPAMPDWGGIEGISEQRMPDDVNIKGNNITGEPLSIPDDCGASKGTSQHNVIHMEHNDICQEMKNTTDCTESWFVELTNALLDFNNVEIPEDAIDKSCFDGFSSLLNSPDDANNDEMPNVPETKEPAVPVACPDIVSTDPEAKSGAGESHFGVQECASENQAPMSASSVDLQFPEYCNGVICCVLNTEDSEIPCNDHIVFSSRLRLASAHRRTQNEANNSALPVKNDNGNQACEKGVGTMKREPIQFGDSYPASQMRGPEIQFNHTVDEFGIKFETSGVGMLSCTNNPSSNIEGLCHSGLAMKKEYSGLLLVRQSGNGGVGQPCHVSDSGHQPSGVAGINQEGQAPPTYRDQGCYAADLRAREPGGEPLLSDQSDEQVSDSDTDIPYFSDVESMILDMDLGPDDEDSFCSWEVAKYEHEDAKRAIIRLEQNAHSYLQRGIASHGAFAILYGRHSKHYIKKPEVLLGRATEDVAVDIDLGREGRANTISRRQAIVKMDEDGTFYMKNLGKHSIYVNNKEIFTGQCLSLHSNCLIEIRGMPFIFETSQTCVKWYLAARKSEVNVPVVS